MSAFNRPNLPRMAERRRDAALRRQREGESDAFQWAVSLIESVFEMPAPASTKARFEADSRGNLEAWLQADSLDVPVDLELERRRERAEDQLVAHLHDTSSSEAKLRSAALVHCLSSAHPAYLGAKSIGMPVPHPPLSALGAFSTPLSFSRLCRMWGRARLLGKLIEAGPPPGVDFGEGRTPSHRKGFWAGAFLLDGECHESGLSHEPPVGAMRYTNAKWQLFAQAITPMTPSSLPMVELWADQLAEVAAEAGGVFQVGVQPEPHRSGNQPFSVMVRALLGHDSVVIPGQRLLVGEGDNGQLRLDAWQRSGQPSGDSQAARVAAAIEQRLRLRRLAAYQAGDATLAAALEPRPLHGALLDAGLFVLAPYKDADQFATHIRPMMEYYVKEGLLDVNRPLCSLYVDQAGAAASGGRSLVGAHPLHAAIMFDAAEAAVALIELGCSLDPRVVFVCRSGEEIPAFTLPPHANGRQRNACDPTECADLTLLGVAQAYGGRARTIAALSAKLMSLAAERATRESAGAMVVARAEPADLTANAAPPTARRQRSPRL